MPDTILDLKLIREQFPSLASGTIHFDNPGGTQVARQSLQRVIDYYQTMNANHGGAFKVSQRSDAMITAARQAMADLLNAARPEEIVFGPNMTTLTLHLSRSLALTLQAGDEIVLTRLDHDANVAPWLLIAQDRGCTVRWIDVNLTDGTLDLSTLAQAITPRTKIVAVGYASNALGTINDVARVIQAAHAVGAICYVDAVQYAAHAAIDVQALGCDFLVCSAYKFFGPHEGILYGRYELLDSLTAYKVRTSSNEPPEKWETGTASFESMAGTLGAIDYFEWVGQTFGAGITADSTRRQKLVAAMQAISAYEAELSQALLLGLASIPGVRVYGITDLERLDERVSTISFTLAGYTPRQVAEALDRDNICVWNGNFYALEVTQRLGLQASGGMIRVGAVHYNTHEEVAQLIEALRRLTQ